MLLLMLFIAIKDVFIAEYREVEMYRNTACFVSSAL